MTETRPTSRLVLICLVLVLALAPSVQADEKSAPDTPLKLTVLGEVVEDWEGIFYVASGLVCDGMELELPHKEAGKRRPFGTRLRLPSLQAKARVNPKTNEIMLMMTGPYPSVGQIRTNILTGRYSLPTGELLEGKRFTAHVGVEAPQLVGYDFCFPEWLDGFLFACADFTGRVKLIECDARGRLVERLEQYIPRRSFGGMEILMIEDLLVDGDDVYLLVTDRAAEDFMGKAYKLCVSAREFEYRLVKFSERGRTFAGALELSKRQAMPVFELDSTDEGTILAYKDFGRFARGEDGTLMAHVWENDGPGLYQFDRELTSCEKVGKGDPALVPILRYFEHFAEE